MDVEEIDRINIYHARMIGMMREMDARWPGYGFAQHKGYPTRDHVAALQRLGPCPEHRRSFAPVREACLRFG